LAADSIAAVHRKPYQLAAFSSFLIRQVIGTVLPPTLAKVSTHVASRASGSVLGVFAASVAGACVSGGVTLPPIGDAKNAVPCHRDTA
jgi:hypothetical protein